MSATPNSATAHSRAAVSSESLARALGAVALVALVALIACSDAAGPATNAADIVPEFSDWSAPTNLGPIVNSPSSDQHPGLSPDGLTLYFSSDRPGGSGGLDIWASHRARIGSPWEPPLNLGPAVNSVGNDLSPNITADDQRLFFHSSRVGGCGGTDIYVSQRMSAGDLGWGAPTNLGCVVNGPANDAGPSFFEDPNTHAVTLYFASTRPGGPGDFDVYQSTLLPGGAWSTPTLVVELNLPYRDTRTAIRFDGRELILSSDTTGRTGGVGDQDLWVSTRATTSGSWSRPTDLGPVVNSPSFDGGPALSPDGTELYFFSARPGGQGGNDLYVATRKRIR